MNSLASQLEKNFSGPVLFNYVWWLLINAQKEGITQLYFLARDGFLLLKIAELFCNYFSLPIKCRYLCCSRSSLRVPTYHLIGDEAYELLLLNGYRMTISSLMDRLDLNESQRNQILEECDLVNADLDMLLSFTDLESIRIKIKKSPTFFSLMQDKSSAAYDNAIGYFRQEGLFNVEKIALVDSGWTGSMQRSLRQLLRSAECNVPIIGFYFGMYASPKAQEDGKYFTWYFDHHNNITGKILFCNNLFECLLAAPHGMTLGYTQHGERFVPIFSAAPAKKEKKRIHEHIAGVLQYTKNRLLETNFYMFKENACRRDTYRRLSRYMSRPTQEEARFYGSIQFCDDITETYHLQLASKEQIAKLKSYLFIPRALRKLGWIHYKPQEQLLWPYGTIAFLPAWKRPWYRWNVYLWEWIRYVRN